MHFRMPVVREVFQHYPQWEHKITHEKVFPGVELVAQKIVEDQAGIVILTLISNSRNFSTDFFFRRSSHSKDACTTDHVKRSLNEYFIHGARKKLRKRIFHSGGAKGVFASPETF